MMKKIFVLLLSVLTVASLAACGSHTAKDTQGDNLQIPNPFVDCDTMDEAAALSGFHMTAPDRIDGYDQPSIQSIASSLIQVIYPRGDEHVCIRKAIDDGDISGDYNDYAETDTLTVNDLTVTVKGSGGMISSATWTDGDYAFAISASGDGLSVETVTAVIQSMS